MTVVTLKAPMIISAGSKVDEFREVCERQLGATTTDLVGSTFTVRVADADVREVKMAARANNFVVVSEEVE